MSIKLMSDMDKGDDSRKNAEGLSKFTEQDEMNSLPMMKLFADLSVSEMSEYRRRIRKFENVYLYLKKAMVRKSTWIPHHIFTSKPDG